MNSWRLIESSPADLASQMALDEALFEAFPKEPGALPFLRVFQVSQPAFSVGYSYRRHPEAFPLPQGIFAFRRTPQRVCIRPTGGGWVQHGDDLIYSVIAWSHSFPTFDRVRTSYLSFHEAIQTAFRNAGLASRLFRCDEAQRIRRSSRDCFHDPVATDILAGGRKIAGGAQRRRAGVFLHQGSIRLPQGVCFEEFKRLFIRSFAEKFNVDFIRLTDAGIEDIKEKVILNHVD